MEKDGPIYDISCSFLAFVDCFDSREFWDSPDDVELQQERYLQFYLTEWLRRGDGVAATGRNPTTFLRVALNIADMVMRNETHFHYFGDDVRLRYRRSVEAIHDASDARSRHFADPVFYEQIACEVERTEREGRSTSGD